MRPSSGLPRAERLRRRADFVRLQTTPLIRLKAAGFLLLCSPRSDLAPDPGGAASGLRAAPARMGVVASKKVGGAVERNRCKRLLRALFRRNKASFPAGVDLVFVAYTGLHEARLPALEAALPALAAELAKRLARLASPGPRTQAAPVPEQSAGQRRRRKTP